jgi:hypothetical protein
MLLQRVWQTAYNRIFWVRQIIVRIYFHAYNRIRVGGGFTVSINASSLSQYDFVFTFPLSHWWNSIVYIAAVYLYPSISAFRQMLNEMFLVNTGKFLYYYPHTDTLPYLICEVEFCIMEHTLKTRIKVINLYPGAIISLVQHLLQCSVAH